MADHPPSGITTVPAGAPKSAPGTADPPVAYATTSGPAGWPVRVNVNSSAWSSPHSPAWASVAWTPTAQSGIATTAAVHGSQG